jgi:hypothetical protein
LALAAGGIVVPTENLFRGLDCSLARHEAFAALLVLAWLFVVANQGLDAIGQPSVFVDRADVMILDEAPVATDPASGCGRSLLGG